MLFAALLFASPALADQALQAPCAYFVQDSLPVTDAVDVPLDIAPAFLVDTCGIEGGVSALVTVRSSDGTEFYSDLLEAPSATGFGGSVIVELPQLSLDPNTTYDVTVEGNQLYSGWSFTTGTELASTTPGSVSLILTSVEGYWTGTSFLSTVQGGLNRSSEAIVRLNSPTLVGAPVGIGSVAGDVFTVAIEDENSLLCLTPEIREDSGAWTAGEEVCAEMTEIDPPDMGNSRYSGVLGCSSTGLWGLFLGPLPLIFLRRRRGSVG